MSKINRGSVVLVVLRGLWKRGSVLEGRVQVRSGVWQPHALPSEVQGTRGRWLLQRLRLPLGPRRSTGLVSLASWPDGRFTGAVSSGLWVRRLTSLAARKSLYAPFLDPRGHRRACTGKRPVSRGEAPRRLPAAVMRLHSRQVCLITRRQTCCFSAPPRSHTLTPVGSLVKGGVKGRGGDDDNKGGGSPLVTIHKSAFSILKRNGLCSTKHAFQLF